jgi:hypothetical protein
MGLACPFSRYRRSFLRRLRLAQLDGSAVDEQSMQWVSRGGKVAIVGLSEKMHA